MKKFYTAFGMLTTFAFASAANVVNLLPESQQLGIMMPAEKIAVKKAMKAPAKVASVDDVLGNYEWIGYSPYVNAQGNPIGYQQGDFQLAKDGDKVVAYGLNRFTEEGIEATIDVAAGTVTLPAKVFLLQEMNKGVKLEAYFECMNWNSAGDGLEPAGTPYVLRITDDGLQYSDDMALIGITIYQDGVYTGVNYAYYVNNFFKRPASISNEEGWEDYGTATISQDWFSLCPYFPNASGKTYTVKAQRSTEDNNIIRLLNPYGEGTPYADYNTSAAEGCIMFDITYPECVVVFGAYDKLLGYTNSGEEVYCRVGSWAGFMEPNYANYPSNYADTFILMGFTQEDIISELDPDELSTYDAETGTIVIKDAMFTNSFYVSEDQYYGGWTENGQIGTPTIVLDRGAGVEGIELDSNAPVRYYNLQGVEVANPENGQLVIKKQGSKVQKVIF